MKRAHLLAPLLAAAAAALVAPVHAQTMTGDHASHHAAPAAASGAAAMSAEGEVRKVDRDQGKLTLRHGPIESLGMPGMTMVFKVSDPKMLDAVKAGDKVKFSADNINGALTVTGIEAAR
jgi:Cu/Ag efflux protein CusF